LDTLLTLNALLALDTLDTLRSFGTDERNTFPVSGKAGAVEEVQQPVSRDNERLTRYRGSRKIRVGRYGVFDVDRGTRVAFDTLDALGALDTLVTFNALDTLRPLVAGVAFIAFRPDEGSQPR
jgi:hypothetical protein